MAPLPRTNQSGNDISAWHMLNISTHYQHICIFIYRDGTLCLARLKHGTCSKCRNSSDLTHFYSFGAKLFFLFLYNEDPHLLKLLIDFLKHLLIKLGLYAKERSFRYFDTCFAASSDEPVGCSALEIICQNISPGVRS